MMKIRASPTSLESLNSANADTHQKFKIPMPKL